MFICDAEPRPVALVVAVLAFTVVPTSIVTIVSLSAKTSAVVTVIETVEAVAVALADIVMIPFVVSGVTTVI